MNLIVRDFLKNEGLNENDILVYLDIYTHGQSFASTVANRTKVDRTTVYSSLKRLLKQGIIVQSEVNGVRSYLPVSPEVFVKTVDLDMEKLLAKKKVASLFVKEMKKMEKDAFLKPRIRIYEGDEAIINLYRETVAKKGVQKAFINLVNLPGKVGDFLRGQFIDMKLKKGVLSKVVVAEGKFSKRYKELDGKSNRETRIVKDHPFSLHAEIVLFNESEVAIIDFHKQIYGIVIESKTLYKTVESLFEVVWAIS